MTYRDDEKPKVRSLITMARSATLKQHRITTIFFSGGGCQCRHLIFCLILCLLLSALIIFNKTEYRYKPIHEVSIINAISDDSMVTDDYMNVKMNHDTIKPTHNQANMNHGTVNGTHEDDQVTKVTHAPKYQDTNIATLIPSWNKTYKSDLNENHMPKSEVTLDEEDFKALFVKQWAEAFCNPADKAGSGDEGFEHPLYQLISVHVLIRHGSRTPMGGGTSYNGFTRIQDQDCTLNVTKYTGYHEGQYINLVERLNARFEGADNLPVHPGNGTCGSSQLTPSGAFQLYYIGNHMREAYASHWPSLAAGGDLSKHVYLRTTSYHRTLQSAVALLVGLLPGFSPHQIECLVVSRRNTKLCVSSPAIPCECPAIKKLSMLARKFIRINNNILTKEREMTHRTRALMRRRMNESLPQVTGELYVPICLRQPMPCRVDSPRECFNWHHLYEMLQKDALTKLEYELNSLYYKSALLDAWPFLMDILRDAQYGANNRTHHTFLLYSGHDVSLAPVLSALKLADEKPIPFAARLVFELYILNKSEKTYLRILYLGVDVTEGVQFCKGQTNDHNLCPMDVFRKNVLRSLFIFGKRISYENICTSNEFS